MPSNRQIQPLIHQDIHGMLGFICLLLFSHAFPTYGEEEINPSELDTIRRSVESYTTKIQSLTISYRCTTVPRDTIAAKGLADAQAKAVQSQLEIAKNEQEKNILKGISGEQKARMVIEDCQLYSDTTRQALSREVHHGTVDAPISLKERVEVDNRAFQYIDYRNRQARVRSLCTKSDLLLFGELPIGFMGLKTQPAGWMPIINILSQPTLTNSLGTSRLRGQSVLLLKIGPFKDKPPADLSSTRLRTGGFIRLWLAPQYAYMPLRVEYQNPHISVKNMTIEHNNIIELDDFRHVKDEARDQVIYLPFSIKYQDILQSKHYVIAHARVNGVPKQSELHVPIPVGYPTAVDGGLPVLRRGLPEKRLIIEKSSIVARDLLAQSPARAAESSWNLGLIGFTVCGCGLLIGILLYKRRG